MTGRKIPLGGGLKGREPFFSRVRAQMSAEPEWEERGGATRFLARQLIDIYCLYGVNCNYPKFKLGRMAGGIREYDFKASLMAFFSNI